MSVMTALFSSNGTSATFIYFPDIDRGELYNLKRDPAELTNLIPLNKRKAALLKNQLISIMKNNIKIAKMLTKDQQKNTIEINELLKTFT